MSSWLFPASFQVHALRTLVALAMHQPRRSRTFWRNAGYANAISLRSIQTSSGSLSAWPSGVREKIRCLVRIMIPATRVQPGM